MGGDAAAYFSESDEDGAARVLARLLDSPQELARLREAGLARARDFSWEASATKLLNLFESLATD